MPKKISPISGLPSSLVIPPLPEQWKDFDPRKWGCSITVNPTFKEFQRVYESPVWIVDVETDGCEDQQNIFGLGISRDDEELFWFDMAYLMSDEVQKSMKQRMSEVGYVGHRILFDVDCLRAAGFAISDHQIYWDTALGSATEDPNKDTHSLKDVAEAELGLRWPHYKEMVNRVLVTLNNKGKEVRKKVSTTLDKVYAVHPQEVINYNAVDLVAPYRLMRKQQRSLAGNRLRLFKEMELPTASLLSEMKKKGLKVDREGLKKKEIEYGSREEELKAYVVKETGQADFNPASPKQVLTFLKSRGLEITATGEEVIRPFAERDPWVKALLEYRGVAKLLGTYVRPLLEHSAKDGRIHTNFNQIARMASGKERPIITGRFSSSDPINLQNQPPEMREFFIAEEGHAFICADYSQIDLRSLAHLSLEPVYCNAFRRGEKVHQAIADLWKVEYKLGKIISLALAYNGSAGRLMVEAAGWGVEIPYWDAKRFSDEFVSKLSRLTEWKKEEYDKAKKHGGVSTLFGRWIPLPYPTRAEIQENDYCIRHWENCVIAFQGQGGTADIVKGGMLRLRNKGLVANAQVHDELLMEVPTDAANDLAKVVQYELEHVTTLRVPLLAEVKVGRNWREAKP